MIVLDNLLQTVKEVYISIFARIESSLIISRKVILDLRREKWQMQLLSRWSFRK